MSDAQREKAVLRRDVLQQRAAITAAQREQWTKQALEHTQRYIEDNQFSTVALYHPIGSELSPLALADRADNLRYCLPCIEDDSMLFRCWQPGDTLTSGHYAIPQPERGAQAVTPDCVITPLSVYDTHGYRIGYGKGFYDRFFAACDDQNIHRIGLAFSLQGTERLPNEPHDVVMHAIITEQGIFTPT